MFRYVCKPCLQQSGVIMLLCWGKGIRILFARFPYDSTGCCASHMYGVYAKPINCSFLQNVIANSDIPPFPPSKKNKTKKKQNNADCYPGRRYIFTYCKVFELHLMATFAKCDLLKFFSMKKKKRFILVVLPVSSGFPRVVSRSSYSFWWLYIWCCLARWQLIGA